ncbi:iron-containing alcohol dehydrogenase [Pelagibacteraceae bacterium]|nr:iron-containing alcohol dehydrogenase [Pelagibacteraceae bacterium]
MSIKISNINEIKKIIDNKKIEKILLITGKNSFYKTGADKIFLGLLKEKSLKIFFKKNFLPELSELSEILKLKKNFIPNLIIAIGGGCVMDLAKVSSVISGYKNIKKKVLNNELDKSKTKVIAIPTTAGSGAEATSNAVIYINKTKHSVEGKEIRPDYFYLFPKLILSTQKKIDASSGFDAISQAIESIFSLKSNKQSIFFATNALKILVKNYLLFCKSKNINNSYKMQLGANLAGKAINISKTIAPHAISYPFTSMYGVPHGHAVSLSINKILKFNYFNQNKILDSNFNLKRRYKLVFEITNTQNIYELDDYINLLKQKANLTQNFVKLGINIDRDISKILDGVNEQRLKNNPVKLKVKDIPLIFKKSI